MRKRTISEALSKSKARITPEPYRIYLVRAPLLVLYVGQGVNTYNRLLSHLGLSTLATPDILGECIKANGPTSLEWMFEEYTLEDCREIALHRRQEITGARDEHIHLDLDDVEEAMIKYYRPPLNTACNPNPHPLPDCYEWRNIQAYNPYGRALVKLMGLDTITQEHQKKNKPSK